MTRIANRTLDPTNWALILTACLLGPAIQPCPTWAQQPAIAQQTPPAEADGSPRADTASLTRHEFTRRHMGKEFKFVLYAPDEQVANTAAQAGDARIAELDQIMSDYRRTSELMELCHGYTVDKPTQVSRDLFTVLEAAQDLARRTEGRFDVTVGPLTQLWRRTRRQQALPSDDLLKRYRDRVGYQALRLNQADRTVSFTREGVLIDLGGIAVGYACDQALAEFRQHGITRALIDAGGDVVVGDPPPEAQAWRVAVAPLRLNGPPQAMLNLANTSVTTSGDAYQFVEIDGVRYAHIVDPATGLGLTERISATVIAPTCMAADSLATAVTLMGVEAGLRLIDDTPGTAALVAWEEDGQLQTRTSRRWGQLAGE